MLSPRRQHPTELNLHSGESLNALQDRLKSFVPRFEIPKDQWVSAAGLQLKKAAFDRFGTQTLGLGDIAAPAETIDAIAAMFDLEGFTTFSRQIEPHLSVPHYLNAFLAWLMEEIRINEIKVAKGDVVHLWAPLPFFVKFMGDGLLVLWDSGAMSDAARRNILLHTRRICGRYNTDFLPKIGNKIVDPPTRLRCGLARGTVLSVGEGHDYVGSCINIAARLQKLAGLSFAFNRRGFELEGAVNRFFKDKIVIKQISIRGIGEHELIGVVRSELELLSSRDRKLFRDV